MNGTHGAAARRDARGHDTQQLPLETARQCFRLLVSGPEPLSVDGHGFRGLPNRKLALDELRDRLLKRHCPPRTRDAVWTHLVRRSRVEGASWTLACTGMALPALSGVTRWLAARYPGERFDVEAEVLSGFLAALARVDLERPRVLVRLRWAAYRAGHAALCEALDAPTPMAPGFRSTPPSPPWGHPDLVLVRAVAQSVLTPTEADLISATRLGQTLMTDWATDHHTSTQAAYKARRRAEHRLVAFLREQNEDADPNDPSVTTGLPDAAFSLTSARTGVRSRAVTAAAAGEGEPTEKSPGPVSNTEAHSGLLGRGGTSPAAMTTPPMEVPRCA